MKTRNIALMIVVAFLVNGCAIPKGAALAQAEQVETEGIETIEQLGNVVMQRSANYLCTYRRGGTYQRFCAGNPKACDGLDAMCSAMAPAYRQPPREVPQQ